MIAVESIVSLTPRTQARLTAALTAALTSGRRVRIATGSDQYGPWVKWDAGSGWTPPYHGVIL